MPAQKRNQPQDPEPHQSDDVAGGQGGSTPNSKLRRRSSVAPGIAQSSRTGQACDRCKARKIKCDDTEGGCVPCRQTNSECTTTDRISNRVFVRGHTENLERQCSNLRQEVAELRRLLQTHGVEIDTITPISTSAPGHAAALGITILGTASDSTSPSSVNNPANPTASSSKFDQSQQSTTTAASASAPTPASPTSPSSSSARNGDAPGIATSNAGSQSRPSDTVRNNIFVLPSFRKSFGDNYLGVSSSPQSVLSQVKGTSMTMFGMEIDLADYVIEEFDEGSNPTSYQFYVDHAYRLVPHDFERPPLPAYNDHYALCWWYLAWVNPWIPVLHRPDFMQLIDRIHNEPDFTPSAAEEIIVQLVIAYIRYRQANEATEKERAELISDAYKRYRWVLCHVSDITNGSSLARIQAWTLLIAFVRLFPRPGPVWLISNFALLLSIEMGMHRSPSAWKNGGVQTEKSEHEDQMRKRVFWTLLTLTATTASRLGRPICIRSADIDVELPTPMDDRIDSEKAENKAHLCSWGPTLQLFRLAEMLVDVLDSVYAVRQVPQAEYEARVQKLHARYEEWRQKLPTEPELQKEAGGIAPVYVIAFDFWGSAFQMILHHPALCRTTNPKFLSQLTDLCMNASAKVIKMGAQLQLTRSLDSAWTGTASYINATFAQLFCYWERRNSIRPEDKQHMQEIMDMALNALHTFAETLGPGVGRKVQDRVRSIVEEVLTRIHSGSNTPVNRSTPPQPQQQLLAKPSQLKRPTKMNRRHSHNKSVQVEKTRPRSTTTTSNLSDPQPNTTSNEQESYPPSSQALQASASFDGNAVHNTSQTPSFLQERLQQQQQPLSQTPTQGPPTSQVAHPSGVTFPAFGDYSSRSLFMPLPGDSSQQQSQPQVHQQNSPQRSSSQSAAALTAPAFPGSAFPHVQQQQHPYMSGPDAWQRFVETFREPFAGSGDFAEQSAHYATHAGEAPGTPTGMPGLGDGSTAHFGLAQMAQGINSPGSILHSNATIPPPPAVAMNSFLAQNTGGSSQWTSHYDGFGQANLAHQRASIARAQQPSSLQQRQPPAPPPPPPPPPPAAQTPHHRPQPNSHGSHQHPHQQHQG